MLPFDFVVLGTPKSAQAKSSSGKARWKQKVAEAATAQWGSSNPPLDQEVRVVITYYFDDLTDLDVDNIIKPIQDALKKVVLEDDSTVTDVSSAKRDLNGSFKVRGMTSELGRGFSSNGDFVHVRVEEPPDPQELV